MTGGFKHRGDLTALVKRVRKVETLNEAVDLMAAAVADSAITSDRAARSLDAIALIMSGVEWDADLCDQIAAIVRGTGRTIQDL